MADNDIDGVPFVAFSNEELDACPKVTATDTIVCEHCGGEHTLENSEPPSLLLFYRCGEQPYLAAIGGRLLVGLSPSPAPTEDGS